MAHVLARRHYLIRTGWMLFGARHRPKNAWISER